MNASDGEIPPVKSPPVNVLVIILAPYVALIAIAVWLWQR